jgi:translation initiation factor IF-3
VVQFRGREIAHVDLGRKLLMRFAQDLAEYGQIEGQPRMEGRMVHLLLGPNKSATKEKPKPAAKEGPPPNANGANKEN